VVGNAGGSSRRGGGVSGMLFKRKVVGRYGVLYLGWVSCTCCGSVYSCILSRSGGCITNSLLWGGGLCVDGVRVMYM